MSECEHDFMHLLNLFFLFADVWLYGSQNKGYQDAPLSGYICILYIISYLSLRKNGVYAFPPNARMFVAHRQAALRATRSLTSVLVSM